MHDVPDDNHHDGVDCRRMETLEQVIIVVGSHRNDIVVDCVDICPTINRS
jgi:hypothetical protein